MRLPNGKKKTKFLGAVGKNVAIQQDLALRQAAKEGDLGTAPRKFLTWKDIASAYLKKLDVEGKSPVYLNDTKRFLREWGMAWGEDTEISKITPTIVREFRLSLRERGLTEATCDRYLAAARAAWNYSVDDLPNPFAKIKPYHPDNLRTRYLTPEQRTALLEAAREISRDLYEVLIIAMTTGLRKSNILNLRRDQLTDEPMAAYADLENRVIHVRQKRGTIHTIPLADSVHAMLCAIPENGTPYFWPSPRTGKPYRKDWRRPWYKAKQKAGIPRDFRFHDLRHDTGTAIYAATRDLQAAQKILGHRQISTTQRYAHVLPEYLRTVAEDLAAGIPTYIPTKKQRRKDKN